MTHLSTVKARTHFAEILNRVAYAKDRVVLTRRGKELVAMIPIEDLRFLEEFKDKTPDS